MVSPAHAGIDRQQRAVLHDDGCFPRPRGDRPEVKKLYNPQLQFPPPTRG